MSGVRVDSVVKTLVILFLVAISPFVFGLALLVFWLWVGVTFGGGS